MDEYDVSFTLPYPHGVTINAIYSPKQQGIYLKEKAKIYKHAVYYELLNIKKFNENKLNLHVKMFPPDNRIRDIDNILKIVLDSLQYAKLYNNDHQIVKLLVEKMPPKKKGLLEIFVKQV